MRVIALDCDGTLEVAGGRVRIADLLALQEGGDVVVMVSPSASCAGLPFPKVIEGATRRENLLRVRELYPAERYYYVSDNPGDDLLAGECGFTYIHPERFSLQALE